MSDFTLLLVRVALLLTVSLSLCSSRHVERRPRASAEVRSAITVANQSFVQSRFEDALGKYQAALNSFPDLSAYDKTSLLIGVANCYLALHRSSLAQKYYDLAHQVASGRHMREHQLVIANNRASLYRRMGDEEAAQSVLREVQTLLATTSNGQIIAQGASLLRDVDFDRAMHLYGLALDSVHTRGSRTTDDELRKASIWNQVGWAWMQKGDLAAADRAFTEGYRLRVMNGGVQLQPSYYYLGMHRRRARAYSDARTLLLRARETSTSADAQIHVAFVEFELGQTEQEAGNLATALTCFRNALRAARTWRLQMLPAERFRVSSEIGLQAIYDSYLKAGMALYEQNRSRNLAEQMFEVAEQSRTTVFEQSLLHSAELPAEYWETLGRYRKLLARSLSSDDDQLASETASLRVRLAEIEASFGFESNTAENSHQINERTPAEPALRRLQGNLKEQEAFLSFHTGAEATYLWAVTRETFEVHKLPARKLLAGAVSEFRDAVRFRNRRARALGDRVRNLLLSGLSAPVQSRRHWILSLDGPLFELPFAAIPVQAGWLGQQHTLRLVPGSLTTHGPEVPASTQFAGWGDPLYNRADLRWKQPPAAVDVELERLPGSGRELRECSRAWTQDATPLIRTGAEVRREDLLNSLKANPAVVHLAMHVVPHPRRADQLLIALGALPTGEAQFLSAAEVAAQRARVGLVTLSGCGSGNGQSVAGVGLFGLIRAWLTGGARAVVATHWPITDDSGFLLASMYRELATAERLTSASVAEALQTAQGSMIAAGGWKADPGYWSAFAVTGKE